MGTCPQQATPWAKGRKTDGVIHWTTATTSPPDQEVSIAVAFPTAFAAPHLYLYVPFPNWEGVVGQWQEGGVVGVG